MMKRNSRILAAAALSALLLAGCSVKVNLGGSGDSSSGSSAVTETSSSGAETSAASGTPVAPPETPASSETASSAVESSAASSTEEITEEEALSIAYEHAGVAADEVFNVQVEREQEDGKAVYQAEFETESGEYEYKVLRADGQIYETDYELKKEWVYAQPEDPVTMDQAAQKIADLTGAAAEDVNIWEEGDDGRARFEGNVSYNGVFYEFELDPETNIIYEWSAQVRS